MNRILIIIFCLVTGCNSPSGKTQTDHQLQVKPSSGNRSFVCFVYHRFGDDRYPSTNISLSNFRAHLDYLKSKDFTVMTLSRAVEYARTAGKDKKVAVITVDDGYASFMTGAMPLLKEFNFPATLFVNTETVGRDGYLTWQELLRMKNEGIEIGNHSHSHAYFLDLPPEEHALLFKEDILRAQALFKKHMNMEPEVFAYPYGEFTPEMKREVEALGFAAATAQNSGVMHSKGDYYAIPRFPMADAYASLDGFAEKANMKPLHVIEMPESVLISKQNPPVLELTLKNDSLIYERLQCFVQGGECEIEVLKEQPFKINVRSQRPLTRRRTLYTITVPSTDGRWYWYSHLWVKPSD